MDDHVGPLCRMTLIMLMRMMAMMRMMMRPTMPMHYADYGVGDLDDCDVMYKAYYV